MKKRIGYVYLLGTKNNVYKIGRSQHSPHLRKQIIATQMPHPVVLVHSFPAACMRTTEKRIHLYLKEKRMNGEWFRLSKRDVRAICSIQIVDMIKNEPVYYFDDFYGKTSTNHLHEIFDEIDT